MSRKVMLFIWGLWAMVIKKEMIITKDYSEYSDETVPQSQKSCSTS